MYHQLSHNNPEEKENITIPPSKGIRSAGHYHEYL